MTIEKHLANNTLTTTFTQAPARVASKSTNVEQVIVVLNGDKKEERILPHALAFTRENRAELVIVYAYKADMNPQGLDNAERYVKNVRNKLQAQYHKVTAFLHQGSSIVASLNAVIDDQKQSCVMLPAKKANWLQRFWQEDISGALGRNHDNLFIRKVEV